MANQSLSLILVLLLNVASTSVSVCPKDCHCNTYIQRLLDISPGSYESSVACVQLGLKSLPKNVETNVTGLYLSGNNIQFIPRKMFVKFKKLKTLILSSNKIYSVEEGAFDQLEKLETLDLASNRISKISADHFGNISSLRELILTDNPITEIAVGAFDKLTSLNGLHLSDTLVEAPPVFTVPASVVHLYLDDTNIHDLTPESFKYYSQVEGLYLKRSKVKLLTDQVFRHAKQLKYLLMEHSELTHIDDAAFDGLQLQTLSLQGTLIRSLPKSGLRELMNLNVEGVANLWKLKPSNLPNIRHLLVPYEFLCCPFTDRAYEDTSEIGRIKDWNIQECQNSSRQPTKSPSVSRASSFPPLEDVRATTTRKGANDPDDPSFIEFSNNSSNPLTLDPCDVHSLPSGTVPVANTRKKKVVCLPRPDDFNPCEDLLGSVGLRVCTWLVTLFATVGNLVKLLVILLNRRKVSNHKLLMCTLAFSNLCMGLYLLVLASVDLESRGHYNQYAKEWQHGSGCKIAGFLSIFSTELAVFTLIIITLERYYTIVYPLHQNMWMTLRQTIISLVFSVIAAVVLAALPLTNVSSYSKVAICLPFNVENTISKIYVTFLLVSNGAAFFAILFSYIKMYRSIQHSAGASFADLNIAKKMALVVITNFSCWAPVAMFSLIAIYGQPLIDVPTSKFLLVFVFPINAFTNPFLYFLGTKRFKHDLHRLLRPCGLCKTCLSLRYGRRNRTISVRMTTTRTFLTSVTRTRTRSNSGLSMISNPRRASSRTSSDLSQSNLTPRNSVPKESVRRNSLFRGHVSFLLPSGLAFSGRGHNSFGARAGRRKSYDLAVTVNNVLTDTPRNIQDNIDSSRSEINSNFLEVANDFLKDVANIEESSGADGKTVIYESTY